MTKTTHSKRKNSITITQIDINQYIIEGDLELRVGCVVDPIIDYINITNGPFIQIGKDFLGKGNVSNIEIITSSIRPIVKVTLYDQKEQNK